ncbi:hypothetical protein AAJ76_260006320 [Vairimorpha ceranae]|uniref:Uncharacterized protein n=2 Tax=Vairimorpha ceranae TaxID=40302 RepID=A0A0F9YRN0_9MICR|nr:hypothetical protein AAJ76_260006320 [Vairimorpha ceranae]KKO75262.1 hypothetical protein AAJ76_260006320 [Vairimorpha ceranae]
MNFICFLLVFKKVISSHLNTHERIYNLNHSIMSLLKDKKRKDNDAKIQIRSNKRLRIENKIDMITDIDKGILDLENEKLSVKVLQTVASTNEELEQCKTLKNVIMHDSTVKPSTSNYSGLIDAKTIDTTSLGSTEPLGLSCKFKKNLVSSRSNARSLDGANLYNSIRTDDMDKKVDYSFPEALKNTINTNINKFKNTGVDKNTSEMLKCPSMMSYPDFTHLFFAPHCNTICCAEQELSDLFNKLEENFYNLVQARNLPEFSNIYNIDASNISDDDKLRLKKLKKSIHNKFYKKKRKITVSISNIYKQLRYQQISEQSYNLIEKVLKFTSQVFAFITDSNFFIRKKFFTSYFFDDRFKYQKYKFTTLFSDKNFAKMITLVERVLYQDRHFDHVKGVDLKRNLKYLANHILDITINLDSFTNSLEVLYKFYIKFKE